MFPTPIAHTPKMHRSAYKIAVPVLLFIWLLPLLAVAVTSMRPLSDLLVGNYWGMPSAFNFDNYKDVFTETPLLKYILNSFKVTIPTVIFTIVLSCMTGFAFAVYRFRFHMLLFFMFVAGNFVPFQILMVPVRDLTVQMGMYNTITGLVLFHVAFQTGFCTLFMRNFIRTIPYELIESARIEGVTEFRIFRYVVLPLLKPSLGALTVLIFTFIWNDYFWALVLTQGAEVQPITAGLKTLNGQWATAWHLISAGSIVAALPPVLLFFIMQKQFIAGLTVGAVK